jgi:hypothetical protein
MIIDTYVVRIFRLEVVSYCFIVKKVGGDYVTK